MAFEYLIGISDAKRIITLWKEEEIGWMGNIFVLCVIHTQQAMGEEYRECNGRDIGEDTRKKNW